MTETSTVETADSGTRWLDADEQDAWRTLLRFSVLMLDRLDADLRAAHDIGLADYEILVQLADAPGRALRMSELANLALVSRSRLTHRVDRLVDAGLVTREPCPTDRRGMFAVLSDEGMALLEAAAPTHVAGVRRYVVEPLDAATRHALVEELATTLAELDKGGLVTGCDERG
ncbi:MAG TPA: MarR family transcriptional regulator [Acidimicrobiales bacterium]|nr:MarR family transcriptional regulator [Acidimicrobiales bacterium]